MRAVIANQEHNHLLQEIFVALRQWPDLDRRVFFLSHYRGQSVETISRSLQLEVDDVSTILKQCDLRLHASLRNFRESNSGKPVSIPAEPACPSICRQKLERPCVYPFPANGSYDISQIAV